MIDTYLAPPGLRDLRKRVDSLKTERNKADNAARLPEEKDSREATVKELLSRIQRLAWRVYLRGKSRGEQN
jgi:hypothetical protein